MTDHPFRINRALNYVEDNLFDDLSLARVARQAAMSPFHFHRAFSAIVGTTVAQYVRSRRLTEILRDLHDPESRLIDVALKCGFESQEAFTRAFKALFDVTPGQYQKLKSGRPGVARISEGDVARAMAGHVERPLMVDKASFRVIGLGKGLAGSDFQAVYSLWAEYSEKSAEHFDDPDADSIGLSCASHPGVASDPEGYVYVASHAVAPEQEVPPGFVDVVVPSATYAKYVHRGHVSALQATLKRIWKSWLWHADVEIAEGPMLEVYAAGRFKLESNDSEVDIYIPIKNDSTKKGRT